MIYNKISGCLLGGNVKRLFRLNFKLPRSMAHVSASHEALY